MNIQASCEVDLNGLAPADRKRIREVGFDAWVDEIEARNAAVARQKTSRHSSGKRCALGSRCFNASNRKAAYVIGSSDYCSATCRGAGMAAKKKAKAKWKAENPGLVV